MTTSSSQGDPADDDPLASGLSSWEEFLGLGSAGAANKKNGRRPEPELDEDEEPLILPEEAIPDRLPSIQDLFPPDLSSTTATSTPTAASSANAQTKSSPPSQPSLDGVLPVSDLFYRSSQSQEQHDDEELPFSAEQSDAVTSNNNKIHIRRNLAAKQAKATGKQEMAKNVTPTTASGKKRRGRKMVRRGMEMLVGGVPINADPPQRSVELSYDASTEDWAAAIGLNTRDFGPLLHSGSIEHVTEVERGLFCEYFARAAMKWDICPKDLREIVKSHSIQQAQSRGGGSSLSAATPTTPKIAINEEPGQVLENECTDDDPLTHDEEDDEFDDMSVQFTPRDDKPDGQSASQNESTRGRGFGKQQSGRPKKVVKEDKHFALHTSELVFEIGVSQEELESGEGGENGGILKSVLVDAFRCVVGDAINGFHVEVTELKFTDKGDGGTVVDVLFKLGNDAAMGVNELQARHKRMSAAFMQAVDDGDLQVAIAAAARVEHRWPKEVRERVMEECLMEDDDNDEPADSDDEDDDTAMNARDADRNRLLLPKEELYVGGGSEGIFPDYSEANAANAPYRGDLGLRLVDAVVQRAKERHPRVIAIGDVHGCIDELQDLLRECDYRPGDLVVFLGDLVCKGPDSISVVQMAREIGAIGLRGNHDFEVIRWHQAIKSGVDPPVVGSEHFHIASCLTKADMKWMYSLPWYLSSKELGALFVHAGFVSGIRLAKQNPRLMMNMRSILPDGTVTSKFFNNWPWARLWDGPQTVLFGHDADRGLQQYEHAIGLDTGCVYGGRLTACILPEKRLVSVSARREYFKYRRKHYD